MVTVLTVTVLAAARLGILFLWMSGAVGEAGTAACSRRSGMLVERDADADAWFAWFSTPERERDAEWEPVEKLAGRDPDMTRA